jgi:hypothetical protein
MKVGKIRGQVVFYNEHGAYRTIKDIENPIQTPITELSYSFFQGLDLNTIEIDSIANLKHIIGHTAYERLEYVTDIAGETATVEFIGNKWVIQSYLPVEVMEALKRFLESRIE